MHSFHAVISIILALCLVAGCDRETPPAVSAKKEAGKSEPRPTVAVAEQGSPESIQPSGKLTVLTRNAPTTWYVDNHGDKAGFEYEMIRAFTDHLDVTPEFRVKHSIKAIIDGIKNGEADIAAAAITVTPDRKKNFLFGASYQDVTQQVVCRRDNVQPESVEELIGLEISVIADSSYSETLAKLKEDHPQLEWTETAEKNTEQLLGEVWKRDIDCTVADSNIVDINRRYFPELIAPFNLTRGQSLAWMLEKDNRELQKKIEQWLAKFRASGELAQLEEKYYGFFKIFDYVDIRTYIRRIDKRFPKYRDYFREAAEKHDLPYILIASQGYQESHWNPQAESPTGVRGIMMLTQTTAKELGIRNRLNPHQSILGGAKYLAKMKKSFDENEVIEPDRTWLALAAYNIGRGHMHDAQVLARRENRNPYLWSDIKEVLPLLAKKKYYRKLKYGYARGTEPVRYVQRIREYEHILENELNNNAGN